MAGEGLLCRGGLGGEERVCARVLWWVTLMVCGDELDQEGGRGGKVSPGCPPGVYLEHLEEDEARSGIWGSRFRFRSSVETEDRDPGQG